MKKKQKENVYFLKGCFDLGSSVINTKITGKKGFIIFGVARYFTEKLKKI